jgi:hypothetical protein
VNQKPVFIGIFSGPHEKDNVFSVKLLLRTRNVKEKLLRNGI